MEDKRNDPNYWYSPYARDWVEKDKDQGSTCGCGYPRKKSITRCACNGGYPECSKTGPDGAVCDNPYHSQDI